MADLKILPFGASVIGDGVYDARNRYLGKAEDFDTSDYTEDGSPTNNWTWGDVQRQNARNATELGANAGAGALASLAQLGVGAIPTTTDTRNETRIKALTEAENRGTMGLSADERSQAEATILNPARTAAREAEERTANRLAAAPTSSLATQAAFQEANQRVARDANVKAGIAINQANIEAKQRQEAELESRLRDKGVREAQRLDTVTQSIGELAKMGGKLAAAQVGKRGLSDADIAHLGSATNEDGSPTYAWAFGKKAEDIRAAADRQKAYDIYGAQDATRRMKKQTPGATIPDPDDTLPDAVVAGSY